jgi:osmotically-inducible protein OsmY
MDEHQEHRSARQNGLGQLLHQAALELGLKRPGPKDFRRSDERIREDVCERLADDPNVDVSEVSVSVADGIVRLEGTVPERRMKHRIEDASASCSGVNDVENRIHVVRMEAWPPGAGNV